MKHFSAIFILLFCFLFNSIGQNQTVDSLLFRLKNEKEDTVRCELYRQIGRIYLNVNPDSSMFFYKKSLVLAENKNLRKEEITTLRYIGNYYTNLGSYDKALEYHLKSLKISEQLNDKKEMAPCYTNIGNVNYYYGNFNNAINYYLKSLKISEELGDKVGMSNSYYNVGNVNYDLGLMDKAIDYYSKSLKISEELGDEFGTAECLMTIGLVYFEKKQYNEALEYQSKALSISERIGDKRLISGCYTNIGLIFSKKGDFNNAINNYKKSLKIFEELGNRNGILDCFVNISQLNILLADSAALTENQRINYLNLAVESGLKVKELAKDMNALPHENTAAGILMRAYSKLGDYKNSVKYAEIFISTKDSLSSSERARAVSEMSEKYESEKKQLQIENLEKENTIQAEKGRIQKIINYTLVLGLILFFGVIILVYRNYHQKKKANKELKEKNTLINQQKEEILGQAEELRTINENLLEINSELEKLSIVARKTENAVTIMDGQGELLWTNDAFERLYEITLDEYVSAHGTNIVNATMNPEARNLIEECIRTGDAISYVSGFTTKQGTKRWTQTNITPIINEKGTVYRLVAVDSEITDLKKAEQEIFNKNQKITDSIKYAKRIQDAFLPGLELIKSTFTQTFLIYKPRDIVSGDFYWFNNVEGKSVCILADCTGHGVPGAFMSMIGNTLLNEIVINQKVLEPKSILEILDKEVKKTLRSESENESDGMAISACVFDFNQKILKIACAEQSVLFIDNGKFEILEGNLYGIGSGNPRFPFTEYVFDIKKDQSIYMFSDGFADQFGGPQNKKFMTNNFIDLIVNNAQIPIEEQDLLLSQTIENWMKKETIEKENANPIIQRYPQIDDITVWGIKL